MLVFYKEKIAFLSVPKTGSTAWQTALSDRADMVISAPPLLKHSPVYRYNRFFRPMFEKVCETELELMAIMRDPLDWLGSWYRYRRRPEMAGQPNATHAVSFDEFVQAYMKGDKPAYAEVGNQLKFLEKRPNGVGVSHLFKYENQQRAIKFLENRLSMKITLQRENVSPTMAISISDRTRTRFMRKFSEEYAFYNAIN